LTKKSDSSKPIKSKTVKSKTVKAAPKTKSPVKKSILKKLPSKKTDVKALTPKKATTKKSTAAKISILKKLIPTENAIPETAVALVDETELLPSRIAELMISKKGFDITIIDVRGKNNSIDFFVICSADSDRQVKAISDAVRDGLLEDDERPSYADDQESTWIVLDYFTVMAHIFVPDRRAFYALEKLWGDGKFTRLKDESAQTLTFVSEPKPRLRKAKAD
jgi:ribosome-associated protein